MKEVLKAYAAHSNDEDGHGFVVFASNGTIARRKGANELDCEREDIESCKRAPEFDQYAPGPVPPLVLIEHGWWFECSHCGRRVNDSMNEEIEDDGLDPADFVPRADGHSGVFCSASCECAAHMEKRGHAEATEALIELFEAKFPGATRTGMYVYGGPRLLPADGNSIRYAVYFTFPGSRYAVTWEFGDDLVWLDQCDADSYRAWRAA